MPDWLLAIGLTLAVPTVIAGGCVLGTWGVEGVAGPLRRAGVEVNADVRPLPYYGKATGPGPWHLMASETATTSLCGRRCRYHGRVANGRHCRPCRTAAQHLGGASQCAEER